MTSQASFPLLAVTTVAAGTVGRAPVGNLLYYQNLFVMLDCRAVPAGGAPTLDVYLQTSADNGTTWQDIAHTQFTTAAVKRFLTIGGQVAGGVALVAASDGALAGETVVQGPWGDQLRLKTVMALGGGTGTYTLAAWAVPKGSVV